MRKSNFELLRIFLMLTIPLYHLCVYGGIMYMENNIYTPAALLMCSGGAIVADFAFMAMSSYFLLERGYEDIGVRDIVYKFLTFSVQVGFIWLIKTAVFHGLYGMHIENTFITGMLMPGVWWFVEVYLLILLVYPLLNRLIDQCSRLELFFLTLGLGIIVTLNGLINDLSITKDIVSFLFAYFFMGYMKKKDYSRFFGIRVKPLNMLTIYIVFYLATFISCLLLKTSDGQVILKSANLELTNEIVKRLLGKYCIIQAIMGFAIFLCFKSWDIGHKPLINRLARLTFYVFLLHETVMGIFWRFGKLQTIDDQFCWNSLPGFLAWSIVYLMASFAFAAVVAFIYEGLLKKPINCLIGKMLKRN